MSEWLDSVARRSQALGGVQLARVGSALCVAFELSEWNRVIETCLQLVHEAESLVFPGDESFRPAFGLAMGDVVGHGQKATGGEFEFFGGGCIDRAQLLATRARAGEVVIDTDLHMVSASTFLVGRSVGSARTSHRGYALDPAQPRRRACRASLALLGRPPVPRATQENLRDIERLVRGGKSHLVVLRGSSALGARDYLQKLWERCQPRRLLWVSGVPGGLEPLGSLRRAFIRAFGDAESATVELVKLELGDVVTRLMGGHQVLASEARTFLSGALRTKSKASEHAVESWIVLDPVHTVDRATVDAIASVLNSADLTVLVFACLASDVGLPDTLERFPSRTEMAMPPLSAADARSIAEKVLREPSGSEIARRAAVLGGDTPLGVLEAARAMVASGDLIHNGRAFVWRNGPRAGVHKIAVSELIAERLEGMDSDCLRVLEAICIAPVGSSAELVSQLAAHDGIDTNRFTEIVGQLTAESLVASGAVLDPTSQELRTAVWSAMPASRRAEISRFLAKTIYAHRAHQGGMARATVGYFLAEGGDVEHGAELLIAAARLAATAGYRRSAIQLSAAAVQFDRRDVTRKAASEVVRSLRPSTVPKERTHPQPDLEGESTQEMEVPGASRGTTLERAVHAFVEGKLDTVERYLDAAVAQGSSVVAAGRIRALVCLARGDVAGAARVFDRVRVESGDDRETQAQSSLTMAWILLRAGRVHQAVRAALRTLSITRSVSNRRGETAAMKTLAACYRAIGRASDAAFIDQAMPTG